MLDRIGNCRIVEEMASGGMAVVYRAIQDGLERTVAIKALKSAAATEESLAIRFEREAQSLAKLQHENIIHVYDFHRERGASFIIMEYVEGIDLYDLLDRCGKMPFDVAAVIALQVARALDYIHYRGILHRDIKPGNIMISRQGGVKLMDFGIVQDRRFDDLTQTGTGVGTPAYMSPEQIVGDRLEPRSDVFSLGIVLYQMVTGEKPFVEDQERSVMHKIRQVPHVRAHKRDPHLPRELDRVIEKCLKKNPHDRWQSAQALVMALEHFLAKHVEINYHSRLVEYLRDQGIVPAFEAEEYLKPALGDPTGSQTSPERRQLLRRGLLVQAVILTVMAVMTSIIHLAPLGADDAVAQVAPPPAHGYLRVVVHPWGHVALDGQPLGTTPWAAPFEVTAGEHELTITHDRFAPLHRAILVPENDAETALDVRVDLELSGVPLGDPDGADAQPGATPELAPVPDPLPDNAPDNDATDTELPDTELIVEPGDEDEVAGPEASP
ncbi:serine/threonine protein kinase [Haliangium sp.]|uniref:serine/threonine protein kinase n=1 Tax=Haliangium sp. TaxID=2663208 RepID=UPI003D1051E1